MMDENDVIELLMAAIECMESLDTDFDGPYTDTITTFPNGLVIPFEDGSEFHVTISKAPKKTLRT